MIVLGPILGVESDNRYTAIILLTQNVQIHELSLTFTLASTTSTISAGHATQLVHHTCYRFSFEITPPAENSETTYSIQMNGQSLADRHGNSTWNFVVPGKTSVPKIGFASCNGDSSKAPKDMPADSWIMWKKLLQEHNFDELYHSFHLLLLNGDQVYADHIWDTISYFNEKRLLGMFSTKKVTRHKIPAAERPELRRQIEEFYEQLYIENWGNREISRVMAAIPSTMIWDDHDIFDGWGSHPPDLQKSELFKLIFEVARHYFEVFQIRTRNNRSLLSGHDYSQRLSFRNYEIITLDNRSHRTAKQVMSDEQYQVLENLKNKSFFEQTAPELRNQKVILFVIPVPIAHLNYKKRTESLLNWFPNGNFRSTLNDDGLDHWDHHNHEREHSCLIDLIFEFGEHFSARYVHIVSGDVHSCGAAKITRTKESERRVNQFVSSAIVHNPIPGLGQKVVDLVSTQKSSIPGYEITLDEMGKGSNHPLTIYERNFGFLYKPKGAGLRYYLTLEHSTNAYEWDQPGVFKPGH